MAQGEQPAIRYLGDLQRLDVRPGDTFVLTTDEHLSGHQLAALRDYWRNSFEPAQEAPRLIVLPDGLKLGVIGDGT